MEKIEFFSAILVVSKDPKRLFHFYKNVLGLPIEPEKHGDSQDHYGCEMGDLHFAIHPVENFSDRAAQVGSVKLAFNVFDIESLIRRFEREKVEFKMPLNETGFAKMIGIVDPDGNYLEFTQLSDRWFQYLEGRKKKGFDVVERWKAIKA